MDLRTRYTALVTLITQYVKFASETLKRAEDEEVRGFLHLQGRVQQSTRSFFFNDKPVVCIHRDQLMKRRESTVIK